MWCIIPQDREWLIGFYWLIFYIFLCACRNRLTVIDGMIETFIRWLGESEIYAARYCLKRLVSHRLSFWRSRFWASFVWSPEKCRVRHSLRRKKTGAGCWLEHLSSHSTSWRCALGVGCLFNFLLKILTLSPSIHHLGMFEQTFKSDQPCTSRHLCVLRGTISNLLYQQNTAPLLPCKKTPQKSKNTRDLRRTAKHRQNPANDRQNAEHKTSKSTTLFKQMGAWSCRAPIANEVQIFCAKTKRPSSLEELLSWQNC